MKHAAFAFFLLIVGCGKVGDPKPPFIRIPQPVSGLTASQAGYDVVLNWTNPARNIDGSAATDLKIARILNEGSVIATVEVTGAGKPQSYTIPAQNWIGVSRSFTVQIVTARQKISAATSAAVTPVDVPGRVRELHAVFDQRKITLQWQAPQQNTDLAGGYQVHRTDRADSVVTRTAVFQDSSYQPGGQYTYEVTAARLVGNNWVPGNGTETVTVVAVDQTPPRAPSSLEILVSDGAFLTWAANEEEDLAGYHVFRSETPNGDFHRIGEELRKTNSFFDPAYQPGYRYAVSALDEAGNESTHSDVAP
jgi:hypothetical protein